MSESDEAMLDQIMPLMPTVRHTLDVAMKHLLDRHPSLEAYAALQVAMIERAALLAMLTFQTSRPQFERAAGHIYGEFRLDPDLMKDMKDRLRQSVEGSNGDHNRGQVPGSTP